MSYTILARIHAAIKDRRGLETLEYAVFAASFLLFVAGAVNLLKGNVNTAYSDIGQFVLKQASKM
jgi:Flp pilus assembly pilin Flp